MAIAPPCRECGAATVTAQPTGCPGHTPLFQRAGWEWDAEVQLCTKCGAVRWRAARMRQIGAEGASQPARPHRGVRAITGHPANR